MKDRLLVLMCVLLSTGCAVGSQNAVTMRRLTATGTGLGLSIVHNVVEQHGGRIDVRSRQGRGSTFVIALPLAGPEEAES